MQTFIDATRGARQKRWKPWPRAGQNNGRPRRPGKRRRPPYPLRLHSCRENSVQDETRRENEATREADREKSIAPWAKVAARGITAAPSAMQIGDDVQKLIARRSPREETKVADPPRVTTPAQTEGIVSRSLRPEVAPNDTAAHPAKKRIVVTEANRKQVAGQIFRSRLINTLKEVQLPIYDAILYDPNSPIYSRKKNKVPDIVITLPFNVDFYAFEPVTPTVTVSDVVTLAPEYEDAIARRHQPYERYKPYLFAACSVVAVLIAIGLGREAPSIPEPNPQTAKTAPSSDRTGAGSLPSRASYRDAQNQGRSITETAFSTMNARADAVLQSLIDRI